MLSDECEQVSDGTVRLSRHDRSECLRAIATTTDAEDAYAWAEYTDTFDASGKLLNRVFTYDDDVPLVLG